MSTEYPLHVRYVLYTHYPEGNDFNQYRDYGTSPSELPGVRFLVKHLSGLHGLLTWPGYEGVLVLFYSPGLDECLDGIANHLSIARLKTTCKELEFVKTVHDYVDGVMSEEYKELLPRLRFFTALDLHNVFGRITNSDIADRLKTWMIGDTKGLRYDSPKIIEAIVRLRLLGSGVPVFRVDHDVLFRGEENWDKKNLEFSSTIGSCLTAYQLRRDSPSLASFIFSASYDHKVLHESKASGDFHAWGRAYATRVFPALPFDQNLIRTTLEIIQQGHQEAQILYEDPTLSAKKREIEAEAWDAYAAKAFSPQLARKFFGFEGEKFIASDLAGIGQVGASPIASVISGAMLYLSDGAILDLPPFSNFSLNVSWIDDHLKYCLHRELRHLKRPALNAGVREVKQNDLLSYSKIDDVVVQKAGRKIQGDLRRYIFNAYLPTLLRGAILDAWITPNPLLKYRLEELIRQENREALRDLLNQRPTGLLPAALQNALAACKFTHPARVDLKTKLKEVALKRITQVRTQWAALGENEVETFASIWARGRAQQCCDDITLDYPGLVVNPDLPVHSSIRNGDLVDPVRDDLTQLIEDACNYIEWTRDWPTIVQVVRSIEQGTLRTDLNYERERAGE
jgi:hypothetical protein